VKIAFLSAFRTVSHGQPVADIGGVVWTRGIGDPKIGAEEGGAQFRDELFHGVGVITEALAEFPVAAGLDAGPVGQLVQERRVEALGRRGGGRPDEAGAVGHVDRVRQGAVESALAAEGDLLALR